MRVVFIGAVEFSRRVLMAVLSTEAEVVGVCTRESSSFNADHCDLSELCDTAGIGWTYSDDINAETTLSWIRDKKPDVIFCFGWSTMIEKELLGVPPMGIIGFHPAALPSNRGRHPLIWALVLGLERTASTFFFMDSKADGGDILDQKDIEITDQDDATSLYAKITECAVGQVTKFVPLLMSGSYEKSPQNLRYSNYWRKRNESDGLIDWRMSAKSIHNLVRGLTRPYVGAHFVYQHLETKVWKTELIEDAPLNVEPGKVIGIIDAKPVVKCGENAIRLLETEPDFKPVIGTYL
jgi:methionyl-tRNA formyltransferase